MFSIPSSIRSRQRRSMSALPAPLTSTFIDCWLPRHYMPATTKVLAIIDKGVQDRVTKNGECLRRHAESTQRWKNLKDRIARTDVEMENVRKVFLSLDVPPSSSGSSVSGSQNGNGYLATPPSDNRLKTKSSASSTISRSMSPFRKLARKLGGKGKSPKVTPLPMKIAHSVTPSSEPVHTLRHRASLFNLLSGTPPTPTTPDRPGHKYSQSMTPDSSPSRKLEPHKVESSPLKTNRPAWNSSTRILDDERNQTTKPRSPSIIRRSDDVPPVPALINNNTPSKRSASRSSMASSRPWSPVTSSVSTAHSSNTPFPLFRPPSRATTPGLPISPRTRPKTPSHIPGPVKQHWRSMSASPGDQPDWDDDVEGIMSRILQRSQTPSGHPSRPPSRSMIPVPSVQISGASRPGSAMSHYRPESSMSFRGAGMSMRAKTPDVGFGMGGGGVGGGGRSAVTPRPGVNTRLPPSSFKDGVSPGGMGSGGGGGGSGTHTPRTPGGASTSGTTSSRPSSRTGAATPNYFSRAGAGTPSHYEGTPLILYVPVSMKDPLDVEVARVVNGLAHGLLVERVDPPLKNAPKEGEEIRAQYAFANSLTRKVITCKLTTLTRVGGKGREPGLTKKVMCRVGGGMFCCLWV